MWHDQRMRASGVLVTVLACTKAEPPPPTVTPSVALPMLRDAGADAPPKVVDIELVHVKAVGVRVSSQVANPKILPNHLVDGDLSTAWNSATGDLVGAWIEITPLPGTEVHELRMTPGFTAMGPKAEDWFTMNPRITKLTVLADGVPAAPIVFDPQIRTLQAFALRATKSVRLEVAEILPGTKKTWREASVSELEVWGTPPPGFTPPSPLVIRVAVADNGVPGDPCVDIEKEQKAIEAENARRKCDDLGCEDHRYPPRCDDFHTTNAAPLAAWATPKRSWCYVHDEIYGPQTCVLVFTSGGRSAAVVAEHDSRSAEITAELAMEEVLSAGPGPELVVHLTINEDKRVVICRAPPSLQCSKPLAVPDGASLSAQPWIF